MKSLRQTLRPGELLRPEDTNPTFITVWGTIIMTSLPVNTFIVKSVDTADLFVFVTSRKIFLMVL